MISVEEMPNMVNEFTLRSWLISGPFHPMWNQWIVSLITLAGEKDGKPAIKMDESMTHEILCASIDPEQTLTADTGEETQIKMLRPLDHVVQMPAGSDDEALGRAERLMTMIRDGSMSPDSDFRVMWENVLGGKQHVKQS